VFRQAVCAFKHRVLVVLGIGAAFTARGGARVATTRAPGAALELEVEIVFAAHGVRWHARQATAHLVCGAGNVEIIVVADLHDALLLEVLNDRTRKGGMSLGLLNQGSVCRTRGRHRERLAVRSVKDWPAVTVLVTAVGSGGSTDVAAAG